MALRVPTEVQPTPCYLHVPAWPSCGGGGGALDPRPFLPKWNIVKSRGGSRKEVRKRQRVPFYKQP